MRLVWNGGKFIQMGNSDVGKTKFDLSDEKRKALLCLLADEDPGIYLPVREKIISLGPHVCDWLKYLVLDENPIVRRRVRDVISHFKRLKADTEFSAFCLNHGEDFELEEACWLLARTVDPEINTEAYRAVLDDYAHDLMHKIDFGSEPESIMAAINRYIFQTQRYQGNEDNYYSADNSYLNRVIDQRQGNPISLCMIYQLVGRRLGLSVTGIGLPGHFLCRFQTPRQDYYIDAFNKGRLLTKTDCMKYLKQAGYEFHETFLMPASSRRILLRMCSNLHQIYQRDNQAADAARLHGYIVALSK